MRLFRRLLRYFLLLIAVAIAGGCLTLAVAYWLIAPRLPAVESLRDVRLQVPLRAAALAPLARANMPSMVVAGPVLPVRHAGSVDVFFEALHGAAPGQVLCIDNGGRMDEGCIGDLTVLEAAHRKCAAVAVDGCHRDSAALRAMGMPVWSRGAFPAGPVAARPRATDALAAATMGGHRVTADDVVALDADGAVFVGASDAERVWDLARRIQSTEAEQAKLAAAGTPLGEQFQVAEFLRRRATEPGYGFRAHLRAIGKSIEE